MTFLVEADCINFRLLTRTLRANRLENLILVAFVSSQSASIALNYINLQQGSLAAFKMIDLVLIRSLLSTASVIRLQCQLCRLISSPTSAMSSGC